MYGLTCTKKGCTARRFMDSDKCFDHQSMMPGGTFFKVWFIFCAVLALVMTGFMLWGGVELVQWVTTQ